MEIKTYPMKVAEGRVYAEITLRDVVERTKDLFDTPILAEIKRLYDENDKLRELVRELLPCYQWSDCYSGCMAADGPLCPHPAKLTERARELGIEVGA